jgi:hypothetical protein
MYRERAAAEKLRQLRRSFSLLGFGIAMLVRKREIDRCNFI